MKKILPIMFFILCSTTFCFNGWLGIKNEKFTVFYKAEHEYAAKELLQKLNEVSPIAERTTGNKVERVCLVIDDFGSVVNGYADPFVSDSIHVFTYSPDGRELAMSENWYKTVGVHEYTHMLQLKNSSGVPGFINYIFGSSSPLGFPISPNFSVPLWVIEGITTYTESQLSDYSGRLNEGYFDAYILSRLKEGNKVNIGDITTSSFDFPIGNYYLYGGLFFRYLSNTYGEEKFGQFFDEQGSSLKSYLSPILPFAGIDVNCKKVYGKTFPELWNEWQNFEMKRAESFTQDGEKISDLKYTARGSSIYNGYLYFVRDFIDFTSPGSLKGNHLICRKNLTDNREETFFEYTDSIVPNLIFKDNSLYFAVDNNSKGFKNSSQNGFGSTKIIYKMDLSSKKYTQLIEDNIRCFTVDSSGAILYSVDKKDSFGSSVYRFDNNNKTKIADSQMLINEMVDYNGRLFVSSKQQSSNLGIFEFNLSDSSFKKIADTPYLESQLSIYDNKLFFISNKNSQYRSYFADLTTNELFSVTESGYSTYPVYSKENNTLYYIGINSNGNNIYKKNFSPVKTEFEDFIQPVEPQSDFKDLKYTKASYSENLFSLLKPTSRFFSFSKTGGFLYFSGADKVSDFPNYSLYLGYDKNERTPFNFSLYLENNLLLPFKNSITIKQNGLSTDFSYPIIINSKPGIESLYAGVSLSGEDNFDTKLVTPDLSLNVKYPSSSLNFKVKAPFINSSFLSSSNGASVNDFLIYSNKDNTYGIISSVSAMHSFKSSAVKGSLKNYYSPDKNLFCINYIRGYSSDFIGSNVVSSSLNYSVNLLKIRKGLWNPNIYLGDFGVNLFADALFESNNGHNRQLSSGIELKTNTNILFGLISLYPALSVVFPENKPAVFSTSIDATF